MNLLAIDEGTTGTTALVMNRQLRVVAQASKDFPQSFPKPGWVEHDLDEIWKAVVSTIKKVTVKAKPKSIAAIGITNQRETLCFWNKKTGAPLARAIVWQDRRTQPQCEKLKAQGLEPSIQKKTGLLLDPYFSATKAAWALENWPKVAAAAKAGVLAVGTIDSFLLYKLTGGEVHATEPSNASRTLVFDIHARKFDAELCKTFGVPLDIWPDVKPSVGVFGKTKGLKFLPDGIPISGMLGDQQAALLGQACVDEGTAKCTYGTGAFILFNTGSKLAISTQRLLTTIAWDLGGGRVTYALEGSAFIAGAAVQWFRDGLGLIKKSEDIEKLARSVASSDGVVFVPSLSGMGAPHWDPKATGLFTGITRGTTKAHMARAVLEGVAFQISDILKAMEKDLGQGLRQFNVDGGASANNLLMQFQSDILGVKLKRPKFLETTSLGAVFAAGLGIGIWKDLSEIGKSWLKDRDFDPKMPETTKQECLGRWNKAVQRTLF